jgi:hypothetical protein
MSSSGRPMPAITWTVPRVEDRLLDAAKHGDQKAFSPYGPFVPTDIDENLAFRRMVLRLAEDRPIWRQILWKMCQRDIVFYVNVFCWTFDPREDVDPLEGDDEEEDALFFAENLVARPKEVPFILYDYQEESLRTLVAAIRRGRDVAIEKSRDMGASWVCLVALEWLWKFQRGQCFLLVSRTEDFVDKKNNPDCLFWKLDFLQTTQPLWLVPATKRAKLSLWNGETCSSFNGSSTTGETARGGRQTAILLDEFASVPDGKAMLAATRDATSCRIFNSTPKGTENAFYSIIIKIKRKIRMHWSKHPTKALGLYSSEKVGDRWVLKKLDQEYEFPEKYPFILDGKLRSPWYDLQCERSGDDVEIAQELDIDYLGSVSQFFDASKLSAYKAEFCRPALLTGELEYLVESCKPTGFQAMENGRLSLWMNVNEKGFPVSGSRFVVGADIATGNGTSNSVLSIGNCDTREKVGEWVCPRTSPETLAEVAVALCRWLGNALLKWEDNGPGNIFGGAVQKLGYWNFFYRRQETSTKKQQSDVPGWHSNDTTKRALLGEYRRALFKGELINPSEWSLTEAGQYVFVGTLVVHSKAASRTTDPSGARANHGDRVIADALMWSELAEARPADVAPPPIRTERCFAARMKAVELEESRRRGMSTLQRRRSDRRSRRVARHG